MFLATLDGSYVLKTSQAPAQEYFATRFIQKLGIPTPQMRIIFGKDAEHSKIREALMTVAGQNDRRGNSEKAHRLLMRAHSSFMPTMPILLMSLVPSPIPLGSASSSEVEAFLEVSKDRAAIPRLHAAGRCWLADAVLGFRDRFASPVTCKDYHKLRAMLKEHGPAILQEGPPPTLFDQYGLLQGNADNLVLSDNCLVAIDNHVQHVKSACEASSGMEPRAIAGTFAKVLEEAAANGLLEPPAASVEFFQHMVRQNTGYELTTAALCEFRLGVLHALRDLGSVLAWAESFLAELLEDAEATESKFWMDNVNSINGEALQSLGAALCETAAPYKDFLASLPDVPAPSPAVDTKAVDAKASEPQASSEALAAAPELWDALPPDVQAALQREPPRPIPYAPR